jgi:hypothetical protein
VREADVTRLHGLTPAVLSDLLDGGLPHSGTEGGRRYDVMDLDNAGLALRVGPRWRAMRWWSAALRDRADPDARYRVSIAAQCPEPGHPGPCRFALAEPLRAAARPAEPEQVRPGTFAFPLHLDGRPRRLPAGWEGLVAAATALRFHLLPTRLSTDLGFGRETGLADCRLATALLADAFEVRAVTGMFLATPYSVWHTWLELPTDEGPLAADPFLLSAFHRWDLADPGQWPPDRSPHGLVWRLDDARFVKVTHAGRPAESRVTIERDDAPSSGVDSAGDPARPAVEQR